MKQSGYSKTPLRKKLGIKEGHKVMIINPPEEYEEWTELKEVDIIIYQDGEDVQDLDFIHLFIKDKSIFESKLPLLRSQLAANGMIWASWPKKASKVLTDMSEDVIRDYALTIKLVDVKVCSINTVWSGLKLVIPLKFRPSR